MIRCGDIAIWIFQDGGHHLGFGQTRNNVIRTADPKNPTLEPSTKWSGWPLGDIWPFEFFQIRGQSPIGCRYIYLHRRHVLHFAMLGTQHVRSKKYTAQENYSAWNQSDMWLAGADDSAGLGMLNIKMKYDDENWGIEIDRMPEDQFWASLQCSPKFFISSVMQSHQPGRTRYIEFWPVINECWEYSR